MPVAKRGTKRSEQRRLGQPLLPLTTLFAINLTVGEALIVAKAESIATIMNAMVSIMKMTSIIPAHHLA
jgi:hypothetical protein